jgi:hypothetical protein
MFILSFIVQAKNTSTETEDLDSLFGLRLRVLSTGIKKCFT